MRLGELAQRVAARRARRARVAGEAPREIVPSQAGSGDADRARTAAGPADPFDAARERLKARIPPPADPD